MSYAKAMEAVDRGFLVRRIPWSKGKTLQKISYYSPDLELISIIATVFEQKYKDTKIESWVDIAHKKTVDWELVTQKQEILTLSEIGEMMFKFGQKAKVNLSDLMKMLPKYGSDDILELLEVMSRSNLHWVDHEENCKISHWTLTDTYLKIRSKKDET